MHVYYLRNVYHRSTKMRLDGWIIPKDYDKDDDDDNNDDDDAHDF